MRLMSLTISNFRVIRKARLSFPDRVIGIIGPNGAGKSSLVEAVSWALYGNQAARSGKDEIKSQSASADDNCEVALEFGLADENYRVVRRLVGCSGRPEVSLYRNGAPECVGVLETKAYVRRLLGLDFRGFMTSFLARQQELNALSDLQPSKRRDHLAGMLGIERLDKAVNRVKEDTRLSAEKAAFMERQLAQSQEVRLRIEQLGESLEQLNSRKEVRASTLKDAESVLKQAVSEFSKLQETRSTWLQREAKIEAEQTALTALDEQRENLTREAAELAASEADLKELENRLRDLPDIRASLERHKENKSKLTLRSGLELQAKEARQELQQTQQVIVANEDRIGAFETAVGRIPADIAERLQDHEAMLERAREEYSHLRGARMALDKDLRRLASQMEAIAEFGPDSVCDRCHRPLGDDLPAIREHLEREQAQMTENLQSTASKLAVKLAEGNKLRGLVSELKKDTHARYEAVIHRDALSKENHSLQQRAAEISRRLASLDAQVSELAGQLDEIPFDQREYDNLMARLAQLEEAESKRDRLTGSLTRKPQVEKGLQELQRKLKANRQSLDRLLAERESLNYREEAYEAAATKLDTTRGETESARSSLLTISKEIELAQRELEIKREQRDSLKKLEADLEETRGAHYYGEKLAGLFGEFRKHLIARIRPTLADLAGGLFSEMTDGKYSLVELDENYDLRVMDGGQFFGVERFSGGEKDLANLCLRLAISLALTDSAGLSRSFVILDEVFGSQDSERKGLIIKALGNLKNRFPQILLITHIEELRDQVEELFEVRPTGRGYSEVRVEGSVV